MPASSLMFTDLPFLLSDHVSCALWPLSASDRDHELVMFLANGPASEVWWLSMWYVCPHSPASSCVCATVFTAGTWGRVALGNRRGAEVMQKMSRGGGVSSLGTHRDASSPLSPLLSSQIIPCPAQAPSISSLITKAHWSSDFSPSPGAVPLSLGLPLLQGKLLPSSTVYFLRWARNQQGSWWPSNHTNRPHHDDFSSPAIGTDGVTCMERQTL